MKKLLPILFFLLTLNVMAQHDKWERIKALKVSFITERIDLTEKEAQQFWPVYNEYENKINKIRYREIKSIRREIRDNIETLTDERAKALLNALNDAENKLHALEAEFPKKLSGIISSKKIILLKIAEDDFKRKMLEEFKRRKKEKG